MNHSLKVARLSYRRAKESGVAPFVEYVCHRILGVAAYAAVQTQAVQVSEALKSYKEALAAARNRSASEIVAKNMAKEALFKCMDALSYGLNELANGKPAILLEAGLPLQHRSFRRKASVLPEPRILLAQATGKKGELRIKLDNGKRRAVLLHNLAYSIDQGETWVDKIYHNHCNFVVSGFPYSEQIWLKVQSLGYGGNLSPWSTPTLAKIF